MTAACWIQLLLFVALLVALTKPIGVYLVQVLDPDRAGRRPFLEPRLGWLEGLCYRVMRVDPKREQGWKAYSIAMLIFSLVTMLVTYGMLRFQDRLPLNPQKLAQVGDALAFNTSASFTTNTNWQS